jgi:ankyrin repeat protein
MLLDAGADPTIHDSTHDSDPLMWAEYFGQVEAVRVLRERAAS